MTKDKVIASLRQSDGYVSGEEISQALGISRAAVNAAVKNLRKDGYIIHSSTNKGYMLHDSPDKLNIGEILALIGKRAENVICLNKVDSTNDHARMLAQQGAPDGLIVVSNEQTGGKGRLGRSFYSPKDKGIYLSMLMRPHCLPTEITNLTAWVAVAMCHAIETVSGVRPGIKWVNDLIVNGRKIGGILTEMAVEGESGHIQHVIVGIGINVREGESDFPQDIRPIASSLAIETGMEINRARLACEMIRALDQLRADWPKQKAAYLSAYRKECMIAGKEIRFVRDGIERTGIAEEIDDDFGLVVRFIDGSRESLTSGEVSVRGLHGYV